jgi:hypothetical protein
MMQVRGDFALAKSRYAKLSDQMSAILPYLSLIGSGAGVERRRKGVADSQRKANEMTDFVREIEDHYPTYEEVDAILMEARHLRACAMRDGAISFWSMVQRVVTRKPVPAKACHA